MPRPWNGSLLDAPKEQRTGQRSIITGGSVEGWRHRGETLRVWGHCKGVGFVSEGDENRRKFCSEK